MSSAGGSTSRASSSSRPVAASSTSQERTRPTASRPARSVASSGGRTRRLATREAMRARSATPRRCPRSSSRAAPRATKAATASCRCRIAPMSASGFVSQNDKVRRPDAVTVSSHASSRVGPPGSSGFMGRRISRCRRVFASSASRRREPPLGTRVRWGRRRGSVARRYAPSRRSTSRSPSGPANPDRKCSGSSFGPSGSGAASSRAVGNSWPSARVSADAAGARAVQRISRGWNGANTESIPSGPGPSAEPWYHSPVVMSTAAYSPPPSRSRTAARKLFSGPPRIRSLTTVPGVTTRVTSRRTSPLANRASSIWSQIATLYPFRIRRPRYVSTA